MFGVIVEIIVWNYVWDHCRYYSLESVLKFMFGSIAKFISRLFFSKSMLNSLAAKTIQEHIIDKGLIDLLATSPT